MSSDLSYFKESDLSKVNLSSFYRSLPSSKLQEIFKASFSTEDISGEPSLWINGYRGPHNDGSSGDSEQLLPHNGLQEVKYWFTVTAWWNLLPVAGTILYLAARGFQDWHSIYFDSKTGECLSHDKEIAASKLNDIGRKLFESGKYSEAKEYFSNAYAHSYNKANYDIFSANRDLAQAEQDAQNLNNLGVDYFNKGKYSDALAKFQQAYDKSQTRKEYNIYSANRNLAQVEQDAQNLNSLGVDFFNKRKYSDALAKFQQAYDKSQTRKEYNIYSANRDLAQVEQVAQNLNSLGVDFFNKGKYSDALAKFQQAYDKSKTSKDLNVYSANRDLAQAEQHAQNLNSLGIDFFNKGKYSDALAKFQEANNKSQTSKEFNIYNANITKAQAKLTEQLNKIKNKQADFLMQEGNALYRQGKYEDATDKFAAAYHKCTNGYKNEQAFKINRDRSQAEADAQKLNSTAEHLFMQGQYKEAKDKYQQAYDKSIDDANKAIYSANINKTKAELEAIGSKELGDIEFNASRYDKATVSYQQAYDKSIVDANKATYATSISKAKVESDAKSLKELGDTEFKAGRYDSAKNIYQKAYDKSRVITDKMAYTVCINKTKAKLEAIAEIYNSVIKDFNRMVTSDITDSELTGLRERLDKMMDTGYGSDSAIVNRYHVVSLRKARQEMNSQLESVNREDLNDLRAKIINLIETEIEVLKELNITDQKLEQELKSLEEKLNNADDEDETSHNDKVVDITSIAIRVEEISKKTESIVIEKLAQETQIEHGRIA